MDKVNTNGLIIELMKENGEIIWCMAQAFIYGLLIKTKVWIKWNTMDSIMKIKSMDLVHFGMLMVRSLKANMRMGKDMVMVTLQLKKVRRRKDIG